AELEPFIDNQVKFYSSGMYVRLGFAVAVNMDPDILIVDEVLAVGDELFQRKCLERVKKFQAEGRTIVVVTHAPDLVRQVCTRAAVLDHGLLVGLGTPAEAVRSFREHLLRREAYVEADQIAELITEPTDQAEEGADAEEAADGSPSPTANASRRDDSLAITYVRFDHADGGEHAYAVTGEPVTIRVGYRAARRVDDVLAGYRVYDNSGNFLFGANNNWFPAEINVEPGAGEILFRLDRVPLLDGDYPVTIGLVSGDEDTVYDWHEQQYVLSVMNPTKCEGLVGVHTTVECRSLGTTDAGAMAEQSQGGTQPQPARGWA
ncbi:MAG: ABC transporter ATP-binding protein, partial [Acidimicrobiales bacterium]